MNYCCDLEYFTRFGIICSLWLAEIFKWLKITATYVLQFQNISKRFNPHEMEYGIQKCTKIAFCIRNIFAFIDRCVERKIETD